VANADPMVAATREGGDHRLLVSSLAVTQTVGYGVLSYAFAVFLTPMARDLHASPTAITAALTLAVLVSAAAAIPVGRWIDQNGGRTVMVGGSILGTLAVLAWSQVDNLAGLYLVFIVIGLASAMVLYEPAFAVIVHTVRPRQRATALLAVTIVAGFASSIFFPLTGALTHHYGWRTALVILAVLHGLLTIPLHACTVPRPARPPAPRPIPHRTDHTPTRTALHDRGFWLLLIGFTAHSAAVATVAVHLIAYLTVLGHPATVAATITGLLGVLSVTGRIVTTGLRRRLATTTITAAVFVLQALGAALLPAVGHTTTGAVISVVIFGLGFGVATIARPALLADRYGTHGYAGLAGTLAVPTTIAKATAPLAAAASYTATTSYTPVMATVAAACLAAAGCLWWIGR
jgi:predicted MFS family arabinose efflux permease